jgi:hypothetical protein
MILGGDSLIQPKIILEHCSESIVVMPHPREEGTSVEMKKNALWIINQATSYVGIE